MASAQLRVGRCWVGTAKASDHRPVIADLTLESR
jgi:endonuclease/exonuclease/phosphatase family metal-dependent hydrolase